MTLGILELTPGVRVHKAPMLYREFLALETWSRDALMAFKCMTGQAPHYLSDQFTTRIAVTGRVTRSCQLLNIPL